MGEGDIPVTVRCDGVGGRFSVGEAYGAPVTRDYHGVFRFTGKLYSVTVDVSGELVGIMMLK